MIVQPVVEPMDRFTAVVATLRNLSQNWSEMHQENSVKVKRKKSSKRIFITPEVHIT